MITLGGKLISDFIIQYIIPELFSDSRIKFHEVNYITIAWSRQNSSGKDDREIVKKNFVQLYFGPCIQKHYLDDWTGNFQYKTSI